MSPPSRKNVLDYPENQDRMLSNLREKQKQELEEAKRKNKQLEEEKAGELFDLKKKCEEDLEEMNAQLKAKFQEQVELHKCEEEMQSRREALGIKRKERDQLRVQLLEQMKRNSETLKAQEEHRQENLTRVSDEKREDKKKMEDAVWRLTEKLHETVMNGDDIVDNLQNERRKAEEQQMDRHGRAYWTGLCNTNVLTASLNTDDMFLKFQQSCHVVRDRYNAFNNEFDAVEPQASYKLSSNYICLLTFQLIKVDEQMKNMKVIDSCDLENLISKLRTFRDAAVGYSPDGAKDEDHYSFFGKELIELIRKLFGFFNRIRSILETYEEKEEEELPENNENEGISKYLDEFGGIREELSVLMQKFNVIGKDHLQETLRIQMEQKPMNRDSPTEEDPGDD